MPNQDDEISQKVARHGWIAISIDDCDPAFTYTCGLMTTFGQPELIIFGLDTKERYNILAVMVDELRQGGSFKHGCTYGSILKNGQIAVRIVEPSHHSTYLGYAMGHCRQVAKAGGLQALQVFWPDANGHLPFESTCDAVISSGQPRLFVPRVSEE